MQNSKTRIFVTTSHISTMFITLYANESKKDSDIDILFIDSGLRKKSLLKLITQTASYHTWNLFHSFSQQVNEEHDFRPGIRKRLTRKWKTLPLIGLFYNILLKKHKSKTEEQFRNRLSELLIPFGKSKEVELYFMTQTSLNAPLLRLFPTASLNYLEHGIGDYLYVLGGHKQAIKFHAVFANSFKKYLAKEKISTEWVTAIAGQSKFSELAGKLLDNQKKNNSLPIELSQSKNFVFILLEAVDMYDVSEDFWAAYIDHILKQIEVPQNFHYLLKTHPVQSQFSISKTEEHFKQLGLNYTILSADQFGSMSAEILFEMYADETRHVFCLFSSACFYLSQFYQHKEIKFWYSTDFMSNHLQNAPTQYIQHFNGLRPMIEEVFSENCKSY